MVTQTKNNIAKIAYIQYLLKKNGFNQQRIANELGITKQAVSNAINGRMKSARVNNWLADNLGLEVVNA